MTDIKVYIQEIFNLTKLMVNKFGARITGSESCRASSVFIKEELDKYCDYTDIEEFDLHPGSFLNVGKVLSITYVVASVLLLLGNYWIYVSSFIYTLGFVFHLTQFVFFSKFFDRLFKKVIGNNIIGIIEPEEKVEQQVIISGHYDSPHVTTFLLKFQKLYGIRLASAIFIFLFASIISYFYTFYQILNEGLTEINSILIYIIFAGFVFIVPMYFIISKKTSPGAGDNSIATSIVVETAKYFSIEKKLKKDLLRNTRLIFLLPDAEEVGFRGAGEYIKRHKEELLSLDTYVLNFDCIYKYDNLCILTSDANGIIKLSNTMATEVKKLTQDLGYFIQSKPLPFGGGGTDASQFAKIGINAISIIGISTKFIRDGLVYHTPYDTIDKVEFKAVEACFNIAVNFIRKKIDLKI